MPASIATVQNNRTALISNEGN